MDFRKLLFAGAAFAGLGFASAGQAASCLGHFDYAGQIESCTIEETGSYEFTVTGASGGWMPNFVTGYGTNGGLGGQVSGSLHLEAGTELKILVGGQGGFYGDNGGVGGGGGGGSFLTTGDNTPLLVAGGGGGASVYTSGEGVGIEAPGKGDGGSAVANNGSGGGGFIADGENGFVYDATYFSKGGQSFLNGGAGGEALEKNLAEKDGADGGFGGGGAGGAGAGGGGGGYSGGKGGTLVNSAFGGTSFIASQFVFYSISSEENLGNGSIIIQRGQEFIPTPVPLPASGALILIGLASLGATRKLRQRAMG